MKLGLQGKRAIITGGSKGIGFATALLLASEGAQVALVARNEDSLQQAAKQIAEKTGTEPLIVAADVSIEADVQRAVAAAVDRFGGIDILVNNAGTSAAKPFEAVDVPAWSADLDLKLFGAIHFTRAALPYMRQAGGGAVVNVTAVGGKTPSGSSLPTSVSRAAGLALTKAMSKDLARDGIRVNAVCIGLIRSDQIERMWQATAPHLTWDEFAADPRHDIPLGRIGRTEEAANVIAFLVSEAASYVSGTAINIDGGKAAVL
ncbi:NAD(P)-dependent dehydrogenase (short-subunit alcohol dehydrogenase family) [Paenibacillus cellulosilyticus]|uniref:NAD(P)-dependent dehydrogenase (Short-subunit alcohol dehydrogenase family) n=1 Tax=Paenibacillus cellulosilyticus TaxID=375489 RepID=A0A2V2Z2F9_9BACL|nr:SDR family oxidoreductase [Paenibacillus cellulosilyticus]PWW02831.1 NAD(P)-dependent dehydrogenase (short-subunit alcohol dehydrogenase family) [Paenibacillus cellulosilyticus]QKS45750.1 SDR family oxidoreductase [Paenibacillus cellulosilyticus]